MIKRYLGLGLGFLSMLSLWGCSSSETHTVISGPLVPKYENTTSTLMVLTLHDGTQIVLSPKSKVEMDSAFDRDNRDLRLDGDASFIIGHSDGKKFVIHTRNLHIEVLEAAKVHVDAFSANAGEQADLLTGKLKVSKSYQSTTDNAPEILESGDMVMINRDIDLMEKEKLNSTELSALQKKF